MEIPENHQTFCKALARVCREHSISKFTGTYRPGHRDPWRAEITLSWESGRHEDAVDKITIQSQMWITTNIDEAKADPYLK